MKRAVNRSILSAVVLIVAGVFGYMLASGSSSRQETARRIVPDPSKPIATGRAHSVIYRVRESRPGQLQPAEKIVLRSVNENGEWRKETIWPVPAGAIENRLEGQYGVSREGVRTLIRPDGMVAGSYFQPLSERTRETAQTKQIAGLKAYLVHNETGDLILDEAFSYETGMTPLWTRMVNRLSGVEIESEALHVIWGVKDF